MCHINNVSPLTGEKTNGKSAKISLGIQTIYQYETLTPEQKPANSYLHFSVQAIKTALKKKTNKKPLMTLHTINGLGSPEKRSNILLICQYEIWLGSSQRLFTRGPEKDHYFL